MGQPRAVSIWLKPPFWAAFSFALVLIAVGLSAWPPRAAAQGFQTQAEQATLVDADSGTVLFEKNADELFAPASMAKLMTVEVLFNEMRQGRLNAESEFTISENAWRRGGASAGGSSMFAQLNSKIKLPDLLRGIIVQSGNDASIAVAEDRRRLGREFCAHDDRSGPRTRPDEVGVQERDRIQPPRPEGDGARTRALGNHIIETYPDLYKIFASGNSPGTRSASRTAIRC